ncbi:MAG: EAL domain-containing protein [Burkholderiaceae bacterium]
MASKIKNFSKFTAYFWAMLGTMVAFVITFYVYAQAESDLRKANSIRLKSQLLANELRQSSNDLTRLVRTYVITGNSTFKQQFQSVIGIRDGVLKRPENYGPSYWDFAATENSENFNRGVAMPLLDLMRNAGFTEIEFSKLAESKAKSDELTKTEFKAIALIETDLPFNVDNRQKAIDMLHDESFHRAKIDIMRPISQFEALMDARTMKAVKDAELKTTETRIALIAMGLLLLYLLWAIKAQQKAMLGCSAPELQTLIATLGTGDFSNSINVPKHKQNSVLGWIAETTQRLAKLELLQFKAIVDSSDDAIIGKTTKGIITSWNRGAEHIFGYSAEEVIGQSMLILIPDDRLNEEAEILSRISKGERVEHFETIRKHKDGSLLHISSTISPIKDHTGRVVGASKIARDITQAKEAESEIHRLAYYDALTGLPNRRLLHDRLSLALVKAKRRGMCCAILFIDLDNFKTLNDTRGHDVGDLLLQQVGQRLSACVREGDTVARFGGDEFVVLLEFPTHDASTLVSRAEFIALKILEKLAQNYDLDGHVHHCTPSIGVTLFCGESTSSEELLKQADLAMYQAKASGRNTVRFFDPEMQFSVNESASLDRDLRDAVTRQEFELYYQPQVGANQCVTGAEVLIRWKHPTQGMVSPLKFIPRAEETGLIQKIGAWVLEDACTTLKKWSTHPVLSDLTIAVNVSAQQFNREDFSDQLIDVIRKTGANPRLLKIELTESMLAHHVEEIIVKMGQLKKIGIGFSLDDFGTGYSSLSYLKRLPLDQLKIDKSFVDHILVHNNDAAIAQMIIALSNTLNIQVMAEGVEREEQREFLARLGCHAYQGYLCSKPVAVSVFESFAINLAASGENESP